MIDVLVLRLEAPLMSFGGVAIDAHGVTDDHPGASMIAGLVANALGWRHGEWDALDRLQARLRLGSRKDRPGERLVDFQTVQLGDPSLDGTGWTTFGTPEGRRGGEAKTGTHIRYRHYLADAAVTVAVALDPSDEAPTLDDVEAALRRPARPLFLGRKACLPSTPLVLTRLMAESLHDALVRAPWASASVSPAAAQWPDGEGGGGIPQWNHDLRDWTAGVHAGARIVRVGVIERTEVPRG